MNRNHFVDRVFQLFFEGEGGGGGIGDVSDIAHGQSGDVEIMSRGAKDDDTSVVTDETPAEETPDAEEGTETFDQVDEETPDEETPDEEPELDEEGKPKVKTDEEVFQGRPTLTDIKKTYPDIFKKFPDLREVIFREHELSKHFGSVEEAEGAAAKVTNFDNIEAALLGGDMSPIVDQLAQNAPEALAAVVDNFLPKILAKSQDLYLRATTPIIETFLWNAYEHGKRTNDPNLMKSAQHAANFIFGKPVIPDPARRGRGNEPHPAEQQLEKERRAWSETRFKEASQEVSAGVDMELESEILKGFSFPQGTTPMQKKSFLKDVKSAIDETLAKDPAFGKSMQALWKKAGGANYPKEQKASIKNAFLARAKTLVPSVRTRLRTEWFGAPPPKPGEKEPGKGKETIAPKKRVIPGSGTSSAGRGTRPPSPQDVDYSKTSDEDLIAGRFTRKR